MYTIEKYHNGKKEDVGAGAGREGGMVNIDSDHPRNSTSSTTKRWSAKSYVPSMEIPSVVDKNNLPQIPMYVDTFWQYGHHAAVSR